MYTDRNAKIIWGIALLTFGLLDTVLTYHAVTHGIAREGNVFLAAVMETHGEWTLWLLKGIAMALFYAGYLLLEERMDDRMRLGIPIGLSVVGVPVVAWNLTVIL